MFKVFDSLIKKGIYFENAFSSSDYTITGYGSIFTGKYPINAGKDGMSYHKIFSDSSNLITILQNNGDNGIEVYNSCHIYLNEGVRLINNNNDGVSIGRNSSASIENIEITSSGNNGIRLHLGTSAMIDETLIEVKSSKDPSITIDNFIGCANIKKEINIIDDPLIKKSLGSQSFDSEGVKNQKINLVKNGKFNEGVFRPNNTQVILRD